MVRLGFSFILVFSFHIVYDGVKTKERLARADEETACPFSDRSDLSAGNDWCGAMWRVAQP